MDRDSKKIIEEVLSDSDRSVVLVMSAFTAHCLEDAVVDMIIRRKDHDTLEKLFGRDGALSSFYGNSYLAYGIGLIDSSMLDGLNYIRQIRNVFSHTALPIDFNTDEVAAACNRLSALASKNPNRGSICHNEHKNIFIKACFSLTLHFAERRRNLFLSAKRPVDHEDGQKT